jgi:2,3-bisphosphoglycerate-dependent phosphoglycerate mutase
MTRLILIRHGQSIWNAENRFTGWTNVELSEKGKIEALEAGKLLSQISINSVHTSD